MAYHMQAPVGTLASHFQILCELGSGGMGVVFKAFDTTLERTVALKFLPHPTSDTDERNRVLREARAASNLNHENIATVYSVEENVDGQLFIVMAYYEGESLLARLRRGPLSVVQAVPILRGVAEGLGHAHRHNVVHRDIKPSNIIITSDGVPKIIDFGLAKFVSSEALTQSVNFAGTLAYMSPEQIRGEPVDARSDLWSLGVITYELLAGRLPFPTDNPGATINAILHAEPDLEQTPPAISGIVGRSLAKDLMLRYQSAAEFLSELDAVELKTSTPDTEATRRKGTRWLPSAWHDCWRPLLRAKQARLTAVAIALLVAGVLGFGVFTKLPVVNRPRQAASAQPAAYELYLRGVEDMRRYDQPAKLDAAIQNFEAATQADPAFALASASLGEAYWIRYRLEEDAKSLEMAKAAATRAAQLNRQLPAVYVTLGRIHGGTGQHDLAIQELQRAFQLDPSNADALIGLADVYAIVGRSQEAEESYKRAIAMRPENWLGPYRLGCFYFGQHRYGEAGAQFQRVLEAAPDNALAYAGLGVTALNLGNDFEAERQLRHAVSLSPSYAAYTNLGVLYYRHRRFAEAAAMMESALKLNDKDYLLWEDLSHAYDWLGQKDRVMAAAARERSLLEEALRVRPQDAMLQADLGASYAQQHLYDKAKLHLDAALALSPDDSKVLERVGEAYEFLGQRSKAIDYLRQAVKRGHSIIDLELTPSLRSLLADPAARDLLSTTSTTN